MSFLKKLIGVAAPVIGGMLGGPAGAAAGAGIGSYIGASDQNKASAKAAADANAFTADQAYQQRLWASQEASTARSFNELQAQKQMDFQERLANSAHQREVADLRAAGLNPILSGTGGMGSATPVGASAHASAPSGASASGQKADVVNVLGTAISSAVSSALAASQVEKQAAETGEVTARTPTHEVERGRIAAATSNLEADTAWKEVLKQRTVHEVDKTKWEAKRAFEEIYETYWSATYKEMLSKRTKAEVTTAEIEARTMKAIEDADLNELLKAYPMLAGLGNVLKPLFMRAMSK